MVKHSLSIAVVTLALSLGAGVSAAQESGPRVLIIPFTTLNVPESQQWMAKGVQENLVADFGRSNYVPVAFQGQVVVEDNLTAARLARQASAPLAIRGAAQVVGDTVRLTAQLIDARTGDTLSTGSVTGSPNDLLKLEDELSAQLRGGPVPVAGPPQAPEAEAAAPQVIVVSQPAAPALGYDPYYSGYGGYWNSGLWGYPGIVWPIIIPKHPHHGHGHHGDDCDPPPSVIPVPKPVHAFPRPGDGFSIPTPLKSGFSLPIPTSGFAPPTPQNPAVQWAPSPAASWYTPQIRQPAPRQVRAMQAPAPLVRTNPVRQAPRPVRAMPTAPVRAIPAPLPPRPAPAPTLRGPTNTLRASSVGQLQMISHTR